MTNYIIRRSLLIIPTLFLVSIIVFFSVRFVPGGVIDLMMATMMEEGEGSAMDIEATERMLKHELGLDMPVHIQYGRWLGVVPQDDGSFKGAFQGNLGNSLWRRVPVTEEIFQRIPVSLELGLMALIITELVALPIGIFSALRQDSPRDYAMRTFAIICLSVPGFWLATIVMVYPSIWWGWSPPMQLIPLVDDPIGNLKQFLLPALLMGLSSGGTTMRLTRTMMLEVLRQDYIRTAWSKGLPERVIILRHAVKNAFIPVVTSIGMRLPMLISGTVVIEQIFSLPGVGRLMIDALNKRDYPIISGINMVVSSVIVFMNLAVDLSYAWLDPRVAYK